MKATDWAAVLTAGSAVLGGIALIVKEMWSGLNARRSGAAHQERARNKTALERMEHAEAELDVETSWRRRTQEWGSRLVVRLIGLGVAPDDIEPAPPRDEP